MKFFIYILVSTIILIASNIQLEVYNISNTKGNLHIGLFKSDKTFLKIEKAYKGVSLKTSKQFIYTFKNVPKGTYAISIFHDENSNGKIDRSFIGIPREGYGVSNNNLPLISPPKFEDAKFQMNTDKNIKIEMRY